MPTPFWSRLIVVVVRDVGQGEGVQVRTSAATLHTVFQFNTADVYSTCRLRNNFVPRKVPYCTVLRHDLYPVFIPWL